jgi:aspartate dehydrogenase
MSLRATVPVALIGFGALGALIARGIVSGVAGNCRLVGTLIRTPTPQANAFMRESKVPICANLESLLEARPELIIEAASAEGLKQMAAPALRFGCDLVVLSSGALADDDFRQMIVNVAAESGRRIYVPGGAIGGLDLVQAAVAAGDVVAKITTEKPPAAILRQKAPADSQVSPLGPPDAFVGSAQEAIQQFPKNVNVAVTLSLALGDLKRATVVVRSNPALTRNHHCIELEGAFGRARIEIDAAPSMNNPKSSALAAYSVLSLLKRRTSVLQL